MSQNSFVVIPVNASPEPPLLGLAVLARMAFACADFTPLSDQLLARAQANPQDANALLDLSMILQFIGQRELGLALQQQALALKNVFSLLPQSGVSNLRVLVILSPGDLAENNALEFLLETADVTLDLFYFSKEHPLPANAAAEYDLAFVAVCESDRNRPLLQDIHDFLASWPRPVLNKPQQIARLSRDGACALLDSQPGLQMPITVRIGRQDLASIAAGSLPLQDRLPDGTFPIIVRPIDSQKGKGLARLEYHHELADYLAAHDEPSFYLAPFLDYRSADGLYRKYRIVLIDGCPFVCHMATSDNWMVHYLSAGMAESAEKRAQEAQFMATFDQDFAVRHQHALATITLRLGLEYIGFDCSENLDGELVIFEFDSGMTIHAMDPVDLFPYKQPQMQKVFKAFRELLASTAARG